GAMNLDDATAGERTGPRATPGGAVRGRGSASGDGQRQRASDQRPVPGRRQRPAAGRSGPPDVGDVAAGAARPQPPRDDRLGRPDFTARALANLERFFGYRPSLVVRERDVGEGILERELDRVVLDLAEPWRVVAAAGRALRAGGLFCAYNPSVVQVQQTAEAL